MTRAGPLRHPFTLQRVTETRDANGGVIQTWSDVRKVWGELEGLSGTESESADRMEGITVSKLKLRFAADIVRTNRLTLGTRTLEVVSVIDPDGRRRELELVCREVS